ncbi:large subunit ribosomal protein L19e [Podila verticillata NRRL 6337]|nr:large subunit ribosomal protein L19e [Podila verticillata NRRL 6337]
MNEDYSVIGRAPPSAPEFRKKEGTERRPRVVVKAAMEHHRSSIRKSILQDSGSRNFTNCDAVNLIQHFVIGNPSPDFNFDQTGTSITAQSRTSFFILDSVQNLTISFFFCIPSFRVSLSSQKRLAAAVLKCGQRKIWLDPNEVTEIANANSRQNIRKLRQGWSHHQEAPDHALSLPPPRRSSLPRALVRHSGTGKRQGTAEARMPTTVIWMRRQRCFFRRLLRKYARPARSTALVPTAFT